MGAVIDANLRARSKEKNALPEKGELRKMK
ncbi:hypothetical protein PSO31014_01715 [Pandoraea soli]|uniref:Transposase n=1 Tax=Pandoraea soli TaxID=2508293 RepID=A0ABY6VVA2_9BURK|nr:hypothetical protein PSO31014_01715 [Pandoraea soli]